MIVWLAEGALLSANKIRTTNQALHVRIESFADGQLSLHRLLDRSLRANTLQRNSSKIATWRAKVQHEVSTGTICVR